VASNVAQREAADCAAGAAMIQPEEYWILREDDVIGTDVLNEGSEARQAATYQAIVRWIIEHGITEVLDVGCNVAALAMYLRAAGYVGQYFGLDTNPFALRIARQRENVALGNLRLLDCQDEAYQSVVVKDVIEHLESPEPLTEAFRAAREFVIVGTYLPWTHEPASIVRHADGYYTNRYRMGDIVELANRCGYSLSDVRQVNEASGQPNQLTLWKRAQP
jgi:SAM-dependent methyltransferase